MKRYLALLLSIVMLLSACGRAPISNNRQSNASSDVSEITSGQALNASGKSSDDMASQFTSLSDPELLQYVEDVIYSGLEDTFASEDYIIENVNTVYYSREYLEEFAYNSQANIFFGYTLAELDAEFQGTPYVFTLGDDGETVVQAFEDYDDTYKQVIKNVAIGSGVILVCVTVSVATGGAGLAPVSMIFAASAKTGAAMALSSGLFAGVAAGAVKGVQTKDFDEAVKAAALAGSEGFKWGAISGAVIGGVSKFAAIRNTATSLNDATKVAKGSVDIADDIPQWRQAELRALNESGGYEQLSYKAGQLVEQGTKGATRPDVIVDCIDHIEAVEVKYYNLESSGSLSTLYSELEREVSARVLNLPKGSTQRIVLDVTGRGYSLETVSAVQTRIWELLADIYPNIPIDIVGLI